MDIELFKDIAYFLVLILSLSSMFFSLKNRISILEMKVKDLKQEDYKCLLDKFNLYIEKNNISLDKITGDIHSLQLLIAELKSHVNSKIDSSN